MLNWTQSYSIRIPIKIQFEQYFKLVGKVESGGLDIQLRMDINVIECIFLSQGRHYDSFPDFTPSSDANWCLTDSQHWEIQVKTWVFTLKGRENLNFKTTTWIKFGLNLKKLTYEIEFAFKLEIFEVFLKKDV